MCINDPYQTEFVGKGSDHLQVIKFWPSRTPGKGVCGRAIFFGSASLQPAHSICISESFFIWKAGYNNNNNNHDDIYSPVIMTEVIARVHSVHLVNVEQRQTAADPQTKPPDLAVSLPVLGS